MRLRPMFLLKKIFDLRDDANPEGEKPFLDHLEDLRVTITRVGLTLILATLACFIYKTELLEIIRRPVTELYDNSQKDKLAELPAKLPVELWEKAKSAAVDTVGLSEAEHALFLKALGVDLSNEAEAAEFDFHIQTARYYRAAMALPEEEQRESFVESLGISKRMKGQLQEMLVSQPEQATGAKAKMVKMQALKPTEGFMLSIKLAFFAGIIVAFPFLLFFLLQFIVPGLHKNEKKVMYVSLAVGLGLFLIGVVFAYSFVLPRVLDFFHNFSGGIGISNDWRIGEYISFATQFTLIFGLSFELPVIVMAMVKLGLLGYETMSRTRGYAIIAILVIAAVITPTPDAFTLMLLAGPMIVLYEICIWLAFFIRKKEGALPQESGLNQDDPKQEGERNPWAHGDSVGHLVEDSNSDHGNDHGNAHDEHDDDHADHGDEDYEDEMSEHDDEECDVGDDADQDGEEPR